MENTTTTTTTTPSIEPTPLYKNIWFWFVILIVAYIIFRVYASGNIPKI